MTVDETLIEDPPGTEVPVTAGVVATWSARAGAFVIDVLFGAGVVAVDPTVSRLVFKTPISICQFCTISRF